MTLPTDGFEQLVDALTAKMRKQINRAMSAQAFSAQAADPIDRRRVAFEKAVDTERLCGCGGTDGAIVTVPQGCPAAGFVVLSVYEHHPGGSLAMVQFSAEDAKRLVNVLGEAIAVAERITGVAAAAAGGN